MAALRLIPRARDYRQTQFNACLFRWVFAICLLSFDAQAADSETVAEQSVLHLSNGGFVSGNLLDSDQPNILRWQSSAFVSAFDFQLDDISIVHFPHAAELPKPAGEFCFELIGNDVVFGSLVGLTADEVEIDAPPFGKLRVRRANVTKLYRWQDSADLIYLGPNGLTGWREPNEKRSWREDSGQITTQETSAIYGDFGVPAKASIEFEVSWQSKPDFVLALGTSEDPKSLQRSFRFEVWEDELIVLREGTREADLAAIQQLPSGAGRIQLQAYIDQQRGQIVVFSMTGKKLAELNIPDEVPQLLPGIWLANKHGDIRLERLRIVRWTGEPPVEVQADKSRVHRRDGTVIYGQVRDLDASPKEFVVLDGTTEVRIPSDQLHGIYLPLASESQTASTLRVSYQDGSRLSGELTKVADGTMVMTSPSVNGSIQAPIAGLYSLTVLQQQPEATTSITEPIGNLEVSGLLIRGRLSDGIEQPNQSCLVWHPLGSLTASALRPGLTGRIVYHESKPAQVPVQQPPRPTPVQQPGIIGQFFKVFEGSSGQATTNGKRSSRRSLHLRTGDTIPCEVTRIDEKGVTFTTNVAEATFVPHEKIKALELVHEQTSARIDRAKRDRLLTLPRMQRDNPPTHLIRSRSGDYLRGRLLEMDEENLKVEVRLETKNLPRDRVSRIIWLHDDELETVATDPQEVATRVQAVRSDGIRLTFFPKSFADSVLSGESDVLGPCHVELSEVDQILIGAAIEESAAMLAFQQWKLQNATEPKTFAEDGSDSPSGISPGTESALVGQPAIDFELEMLDGSTFHLNDYRGKIVVLDFWATWCGPCIQSMPQVEQVVSEFKDQDVQLIAVNLQETPARITSMLERHKLNLRVALDQDGVVAEKYRVNAIPETIIIDGSGNIARVFIGGGTKFPDNLREALKAVLGNAETLQGT